MTYVYDGNGVYVLGVPARDLTDDEWAALTDEQKKQAKALYRKETPDAKGGK